jgi:hypothetical protein
MGAGRYDQAIVEFQRLSGSGETAPANFAYAYLKAGDTLRARELVSERKDALIPAGQAWRPSHELLIQSLVVGDTATLLRNLDAMIQSKTLSPTIRCEPYFDDLIAIDSARALMEAGLKLQF